MPYISDDEYRRLKEDDDRRCPRCGDYGRYYSGADYRYTNLAKKTLQCPSCGHLYEVWD